MAEGRESKRIHISGLNPNQCSVQDLRSRFDSFQLQVIDIYNWPPGKDGVGNVQNWCFLTLQGEGAKIKRAMQVLNGTLWKGSKLRLGEAKDQQWVSRGETSKVEDDSEEAELKKSNKKRGKRIESERIDKPIQPEDVDEGLWGWHKTPAGHLIKPVHLRPDHPLPKPRARPTDPSEENKRKNRAAMSLKPPTRAKRVTLDPARYGSVHLSGLMLDDGSDARSQNDRWECVEGDCGNVEWISRDTAGNIVKTERVQISKHIASSPEQAETGENDDADSIMGDLGDALDNASSISSSEAESLEEDEAPVLPEERLVSNEAHFDPGEESDFSEGYQEVQHDSSTSAKVWQDEKQGQFDLLKKMFGSLPLERIQPISRETIATEAMAKDSDEEEVEPEIELAESTEIAKTEKKKAATTRAEKRAALLKSFTPSVKSQSFKPLVRFDPGMEEDAPVPEKIADATPAAVRKAKAPKINEESLEIPQVQMSSLKDMFRPKEDSAAFSLLADLDLDLDLEEESEEEEVTQDAPFMAHMQTNTIVSSARTPAPISSVDKAPMFFPTFDGNDKSWLSILQNDPTVKPFRRDQSDEEIQAIWSERKRTLTQEYKRRHREALKKKKRKYTGSRIATTT